MKRQLSATFLVCVCLSVSSCHGFLNFLGSDNSDPLQILTKHLTDTVKSAKDIDANLNSALKLLQEKKTSTNKADIKQVPLLRNFAALKRVRQDVLCAMDSFNIMRNINDATGGIAMADMKPENRVAGIAFEVIFEHASRCQEAHLTRFERLDKDDYANILSKPLRSWIVGSVERRFNREWTHFENIYRLRHLCRAGSKTMKYCSERMEDWIDKGKQQKASSEASLLKESLERSIEDPKDRAVLADKKCPSKEIERIFVEHVANPCENYLDEMESTLLPAMFDYQMLDLHVNLPHDLSIREKAFYEEMSIFKLCSLMQQDKALLVDGLVGSVRD